MTTLTDKFDALETQLNTIEAAANTDRDLTNTKLQSMLDLLDIINTNAAANTKALLAALGQTGACFPCPTPSITVPTTPTTPTTIDTVSCQRSQGLIATIHSILAAMDTLQSFNVIGSYNVISDAISQVVGAVTAGDTLPLPSFPETVNIVGDYVSYAGERVFSGVGLVEQFSPLEASLVSAMWVASDPASAQSAYNGVIDSSSASNGAKLLFKALAYNALVGYYYDPTTLPDVSGYSGTACATYTCETLHSALTSINGGGALDIIVWPANYFPTNNSFGTTSDHLTWATIDMIGFRITPSVPVSIFLIHTNPGIPIGTDEYVIPSSTDSVAIVRNGGSGPFIVDICPPA